MTLLCSEAEVINGNCDYRDHVAGCSSGKGSGDGLKWMKNSCVCFRMVWFPQRLNLYCLCYIYIFVFVCLFVSYGIPDLFKFGQPAAPCFGVLFVRDSKGAAVYGETLPTAKAYRAPVIF